MMKGTNCMSLSLRKILIGEMVQIGRDGIEVETDTIAGIDGVEAEIGSEVIVGIESGVIESIAGIGRNHLKIGRKVRALRIDEVKKRLRRDHQKIGCHQKIEISPRRIERLLKSEIDLQETKSKKKLRSQKTRKRLKKFKSKRDLHLDKDQKMRK